MHSLLPCPYFAQSEERFFKGIAINVLKHWMTDHMGVQYFIQDFVQGNLIVHNSCWGSQHNEKFPYNSCHICVIHLHKISGLEKTHKNSHTRYNSNLEFCKDMKLFLTLAESLPSEVLCTEDLENEMEAKVVFSYPSYYSHFRNVDMYWRRRWGFHWCTLLALQGCFCC